MLKAGTLTHGGIMVNYRCSAACRHCLYSCSPTRSSGYADEETTEKFCALLRKGGCRSVHIGGGEPFLDFEKLVMVMRKLHRAGITLEYVETNAFWTAGTENLKSASEKLRRLLDEGGPALCISIDPYHAEYVPYGAPIALAKLCEKTGVDYFLWKREFLPALSKLDSGKAHQRAEIEKAISRDYIYSTARSYGIGYGGRAVNIEREFKALYPVENFEADSSPCRNLISGGHFHVDKDAYYIPPRCTGIRIPLEELVNGIPPAKYPAFEALYTGGFSALFRLAGQYGFTPDAAGYPSKCNLCFHLRHFLSEKNLMILLLVT